MNKKNKKSKKHRRHSNASINTLNNKKLDLGFISWAENYTSAVTGQLKHQVQYWKARAFALLQENEKLHKIIQENNYKSKSPSNSIDDYVNYYNSSNENKKEGNYSNSNHDDEYLSEDNSECSIQVSKEYIEFLVKNKDFKEQARKEKERLRLKQESEDQEQLEKMTKAIPTPESLKRLYGNNWERINAIETALTCKWVAESNIHNPSYWPIIPFNLKDL